MVRSEQASAKTSVQEPVVSERSVEVGGRTRTFTVVAGEAGEQPRPSVLVFHGSKQSAAAHRRFTGRQYDALAADGVVVAYLDGYRGNWNDARRDSRFPARLEGLDDVGFAKAVITQLVTDEHVDPDRVVAAGYSNGGQLVLRLLHEAPELIGAGLVIAATKPVADDFLAPDPPGGSRPVVLVHGTADPIVAYDGGAFPAWARRLFKVGGRSLSAPQTAAYFAERNGIVAAPTTDRLPSKDRRGRTRVERTAYHQPGRPAVVLYTVHGGGHTVPGPARAPFVVGRTTQDVSAADLVGDLVRELSRAR